MHPSVHSTVYSTVHSTGYYTLRPFYSIVKYYDIHKHLKHNWLLAYSGRGGSIEKWLLCKRNIAEIVNWSNSLLTEVVGRARLHMCSVMCVCACVYERGGREMFDILIVNNCTSKYALNKGLATQHCNKGSREYRAIDSAVCHSQYPNMQCNKNT